jgi:hypothetical protein
MEKIGDLAVSTQLERCQAGVQTPLLFVEHTGEQDNRRMKFIGYLVRQDAFGYYGGLLQQRLPRPHLLLPRSRVAGAVEI